MRRFRVVSPASVALAGLVLAPAVPLLAQEPAAPADVPAYELRRALLESTRWEPATLDAPSDDQRTVFYNPRSVEGTALQVFVQPPEEIPAVPEAIFRVSSWLVPEGDTSDRLGDLVGVPGAQVSRGNRTVVHLYGDVRLSFAVAGAPRIGDEFLVYRLERSIPDVGDVLVPTGRVRVTGSEGEWVIGRIVEEYARIEVGNHVGRLRSFLLRPGVHPQPSNLGVRATILAFEEVRELYLPGQMAYLEAGRPQGLAVGDEFVAFAEEERGTAVSPIARFQVVHVGEETSTLRVLEVRSPQLIRPGLQVVLDRKMP